MVKGVKKLFFILSAVLLVCGCVATQTNTHVMHLYGYHDSVSHSVNSKINFDFGKIETFQIIDPPDGVDYNQLQGLRGASIKFALYDALIARGFRLAEEGATPDMVVTIAGRVDTSSQIVQGGIGYLPIWKPGQTYTYNSYSSGSYSGSTHGTLNTPGAMNYLPYQRPAKEIVSNQASLAIAAYDTNNNEELFVAQARGKTSSGDPSVACQYLLGYLNFPGSPKRVKEYEKETKWQGVSGVVAAPRSDSGGRIFPLVLNVVPNSPASYAGIKKEDFIISVDGYSLENKSFVEFTKNYETHPGDKVKFTIWRGGQATKDIIVKLQSRTEVYQ